MKNLIFVLMFMIATVAATAQDVAGKSITSNGFSFSNHLENFSWIYITALFVVLLGLFVFTYFFGWDKKLFKSKAGEDNNHMFI